MHMKLLQSCSCSCSSSSGQLLLVPGPLLVCRDSLEKRLAFSFQFAFIFFIIKRKTLDSPAAKETSQFVCSLVQWNEYIGFLPMATPAPCHVNLKLELYSTELYSLIGQSN